jgi:hypothetical protein
MQIDNETWHESLARLRAERKMHKEATAQARRDKTATYARKRRASRNPFNLERHLAILNNKLVRALDTTRRAFVRDICERNANIFWPR